MQIGIVGLPNVGKSTIFSVLTKISVAIDKFPFTTINPNIGIVARVDERQNFLAELFQPQKVTAATIKFVDIAGLIKDASKGAGLGNKFLATIREVDAIVHVLRYFSDDTVTSSIQKIDPIEEIQVVNTELCIADLEVLERYNNKIIPKAYSGDTYAKEQLEIVSFLIKTLNNGILLSKVKDEIELKLENKHKELKSLIYQLLTYKPRMYLLNYDETIPREKLNQMKLLIENFTKDKTLCLAGKFELSLQEMSLEEQKQFREEYGIPPDELNNFIQQAVELLNMVTFYTAVGTELRAWMVKKGTTVYESAGKIHSDMKEGFINAEVYNFVDLKKYGSIKALQEHGLLRIESKDYIVQDGDIIKINFRK